MDSGLHVLAPRLIIQYLTPAAQFCLGTSSSAYTVGAPQALALRAAVRADVLERTAKFASVNYVWCALISQMRT